MDTVDFCTQELNDTRWRFYKPTRLTVFAALIEDMSNACKNSLVPELLLKNHITNCQVFGQNKMKPPNDSI